MDSPRLLDGFGELRVELIRLRSLGLHRSPPIIQKTVGSRLVLESSRLINFSSNDYLGLAGHPSVIAGASRALRAWGAGSGASRLLCGNLKIHCDLERRLARFKKEEAALVYSSGYLANLGAVTALLNEKDLVLMDRFNHASLIDAARLSKATWRVYRHGDATHVEKLLEKSGKGFRRKLVMTDAYFSMDGDLAPLDRLARACRRHGAWLMADEAHATGVFGKTGGGLVEHFGLSGKVAVVMGTLSKALGSVGGFVAGSCILKDYLINRSREYRYTTAPSPSASAAALAALECIETGPGLREKLWNNVRRLRRGLLVMGLDLMGSEGPIIPIAVRDTRKALLVQRFLRQEGFFAPAIRPPTVSRGTDRIRLSVTAAHTDRDLDALLKALYKTKKKFL